MLKVRTKVALVMASVCILSAFPEEAWAEMQDSNIQAIETVIEERVLAAEAGDTYVTVDSTQNAELLDISGSVLKGINQNKLKEYKANNGIPDSTNVYIDLTVPADVTEIASMAFTMKRGFLLNSLSFEVGSRLKTIQRSAFAFCGSLTGELVLPEGLTDIKASAFRGCGITGLILPEGLKYIGRADDGSSFASCSKLEYVKTDLSEPDAVFELPESLIELGRKSFEGSFASWVQTSVHIPAAVEKIGSDVFYKTDNRITNIYIDRPFSFDAYNGYNGAAFKGNAYGPGKRMVIFPSGEARAAFNPVGFSTYKKACTFVIELTYEALDGTVVRTEKKLNDQSIKLEYNEFMDSWEINNSYKLPELLDNFEETGYKVGWSIDGKVFDESKTLSIPAANPYGDKLTVIVSKEPVSPKLMFLIDGMPVSNYKDSYSYDSTGLGKYAKFMQFNIPLANDGREHEIVAAPYHPLAEDIAGNQQDGSVSYKYIWADVLEGKQGPRAKDQGFYFYPGAEGVKDETYDTLLIRDKADLRQSGSGYNMVMDAYYSGNAQDVPYFQTSTGIIGDKADCIVQLNVDHAPVLKPADFTVYTGECIKDGMVVMPEISFEKISTDNTATEVSDRASYSAYYCDGTRWQSEAGSYPFDIVIYNENNERVYDYSDPGVYTVKLLPLGWEMLESGKSSATLSTYGCVIDYSTIRLKSNGNENVILGEGRIEVIEGLPETGGGETGGGTGGGETGGETGGGTGGGSGTEQGSGETEHGSGTWNHAGQSVEVKYTYTEGLDGSWRHMDNEDVNAVLDEAVPEGATPVKAPEWHRWKFFKNDGSVIKNGWAYIINPYAIDEQHRTSWFYFDQEGLMKYGWFLDERTNNWYYLNEYSDSTLGMMKTGWYHDLNDNRWYYLDPASGALNPEVKKDF